MSSVPLATGYDFALALYTNGSVYAWGENNYGQLGNGTTTSSDTPVAVSGLTGISALAGGAYHALALSASGNVFAWGDNANGQLGDGTLTNATTPVEVMEASGTPLSGIVAIAGGYDHSLALSSSGNVYAWGGDGHGELGDNFASYDANPCGCSTTPVEVLAPSGNAPLSGIVAISAGGQYSLALSSSGTVYAFGYDLQELTDTGLTETAPSQPLPVPVSGLPSGVSAIAAGYGHALALDSAGNVWAWGDNTHGELGNGSISTSSDSPVEVSGLGGSGVLSGVSAIAAGVNFSFAVGSSGSLCSWGDDDYGELGDGSGSVGESRTPVEVSGLTGVTTIAAGHEFAAAQDSAGSIYTWGENNYGQLGDGSSTTLESTTPTQATWPPPGANTPPSVLSTLPSAYSDTTGTPKVSVTWTDNEAGVNPSSLTLSVDGSSVPSNVSGDTISAEVSLSPGIHLVTSSASNNTGSATATYSFDFSIATLSDAGASASLASQTVSVPAGATSVSFTNPEVHIGAFSEEMNASARAGYGVIERPYSFGSSSSSSPGQVSVLFYIPEPSDGTGSSGDLAKTTVYQATPSYDAPHGLAVLAPSATSLGAEIPAAAVTIPTITVPVPTGYNAGAAYAELLPASTSLGVPAPPPGESVYLAGSFSRMGAFPVLGNLGACLDGTVGPATGSSSNCTVAESASLRVLLSPLGTIQVAAPLPLVNSDQSSAWTAGPACAAANGGSGCLAGSGQSTTSPLQAVSAAEVFGCGLGTLPSGATYNLCSLQPQSATDQGYLGVYLNAWVFDDAGGGFPLWQQDHVNAPPGGDSCPNGASGSVTASIYRAAANATASDGSLDPLLAGTYRAYSSNVSPLPVELGAATQADSSSGSDGAQSETTSRGYEITTTFSPSYEPASAGYYTLNQGATMDASGVLNADASSTSNSWYFDTTATPSSSEMAGLPQGELDLVTGTELVSPASTSAYSLGAMLSFESVVNFSNCTGGS